MLHLRNENRPTDTEMNKLESVGAICGRGATLLPHPYTDVSTLGRGVGR